MGDNTHEDVLASMSQSGNIDTTTQTAQTTDTPLVDDTTTPPAEHTADEARLLQLMQTDVMGLTEAEHEAWSEELNRLSEKVTVEDTADTSTTDNTDNTDNNTNQDENNKKDANNQFTPEEALTMVNSLIGVPIKMAGTEVTFNSVDELKRGLQQAADYVRKTTEIKPYRVALKRMQDAGLLENEADFALMLDAYKGDKDAISQLASLHGVEELTSEEELKNFVPSQSNVTVQTIALDDVIASLKTEGKLESVQPIISTKFDDASTELVQNTPQILTLLAEDVESGLYAKVESAMVKQKLLGMYNDNSSYLDNYMNTVIDLKKKQAPKPQQPNNQLGTRVSGTPTPNTQKPAKKGVTDKVVHSLIDAMANMSDEEYLKTFGTGS